MHIAEGFLPPLHAAAWTLAAAPFVVHGTRSAAKIVRANPNAKLLLGAAGAFTFVMSAIKLPSVTGSSSHPTGTGVGAIIFRPPVMALLGTIVLFFQAVLLAHGGLTTLGANVFSMAVAGPWVGYWAFKALAKAPFAARVFVGVALANLATYATTATQLAIAYPQGGFVSAWERFMGIFAVTQVPLAIVEGLIGILLINALISWARPEMEDLGVIGPEDSHPSTPALPDAAAKEPARV